MYYCELHRICHTDTIGMCIGMCICMCICIKYDATRNIMKPSRTVPFEAVPDGTTQSCASQEMVDKDANGSSIFTASCRRGDPESQDQQ